MYANDVSNQMQISYTECALYAKCAMTDFIFLDNTRTGRERRRQYQVESSNSRVCLAKVNFRISSRAKILCENRCTRDKCARYLTR